MDVRISTDLCDEEKKTTQKRVEVVKRCLRSHGIDYNPENPPRVALLGSGGGQRADVACLGTIRQLGKENLLDSFLYLAGVSGSTWAMASLYDDAQWSKNVPSVVSRALQSMSEGSSSSFSECVQWLRERETQKEICPSPISGVWWWCPTSRVYQ
ncbi:hypothetical protein ACEWY4_017832 [Coilia grayii]|uniref:PLA2c domain-containing protein n=1 Tax=Coilia grayii TaxID=363190 RepID=A0ABD1JHZ6_9TELE